MVERVVGSGTNADVQVGVGELEQAVVARGDEVGPRCGVLDVEQDPASVAAQGGGNREQSPPDPFGFPPAGGWSRSMARSWA